MRLYHSWMTDKTTPASNQDFSTLEAHLEASTKQYHILKNQLHAIRQDKNATQETDIIPESNQSNVSFKKR